MRIKIWQLKMKTGLLIIIGIVIVSVIIALTIGTMGYQSAYNQNCNSDGGYVVGFLKCIYINEDFAEPESNSEINIHCMTLEQSKDIAPFFKVPSYLPEGYLMKCSRSAMPSESYILYHNNDISDEWVGKIPILIDEGAIFILQIDERTLVREKKFATFDTAEQRIQETYDDVIESNPSLNPQLIRINGMLAYAVDSCLDCGMQTADFPDGTSIQKSTSTETKIKFIDKNGISYMLKTTLSLDELILVAESLQ